MRNRYAYYSDYYPFGMLMPGRNGGEYRYGYQGSEKDNEVKGKGNSYTTFFRGLDPRLGRWLSIDPLASSMPWQSPYCSMDNNPIMYNDILGDSTDYGITNAGRIYQIGKTNDKPDRLFKIDDTKNKIDITGKDYVNIEDKSLLNSFLEDPRSEETINIDGKSYPKFPLRGKVVAFSKNQKDIANFFYFAANNTNVEFSITSFKDGNNAIGTLHNPELSSSLLGLMQDYKIKDVLSWTHSHPYDKSHKNQHGRLRSMWGDAGIVDDFISTGTFTFKFNVYFPRAKEALELKDGPTKAHRVESYWGILKLLK